MSNPDSLEGFTFWKWLEEDGDGINLVITDARRQAVEDCMAEFLTKQAASHIDETGNAVYPVEALEEAWRACFIPLQ